MKHVQILERKEKDEKKNEVRNGNSVGSSRWDDVIFRL